MEEATGAPPSRQKFANAQNLGAGRNFAACITAENNAVQIAAVFLDQGQAGLAILVMPHADQADTLMNALLQTEFQRDADVASPARCAIRLPPPNRHFRPMMPASRA